ncbi:DUF1206 domain-containing protein [Demequina sp. TTPB684]|uniref:DUF1206 domain-containing protein n=1 Tax=unclassified Demequina TaxID=2620311 RepID=UPI001CF3FB66|nr:MULTISPECIES: DUF1206 domain-containing protein [unclassified Demequina]MCB2411885.1 DUF1206 domain-containing protein [Demequina sp. TTPB684]UPU87373.1 DUF1206 domain-containing protein [Demequina sp. TMPB413]
MTTSANGTARNGTSGDVWEKTARGGYAITGLVHIVLGYLIARLAFGGSSGEASQSSALSQLSETPVGGVVIWVAVGAWAALAAWQIADALRSHDEGKDRAKAAGKAVVYAVLAFVAYTVAQGTGGSSNGDSQAQGYASDLMQAPGGRVLLGAIGLGILAAGAYHVYKGVTKKFEEDLTGAPNAVKALGTVGYPAKGVALGAVGAFFTYAALTADPDKARGLDGAIGGLLDAPFGQPIVIAVGVGFAAYGLYSFGRARYAKM